jgi:S-adenosylmethionine synthetase
VIFRLRVLVATRRGATGAGERNRTLAASLGSRPKYTSTAGANRAFKTRSKVEYSVGRETIKRVGYGNTLHGIACRDCTFIVRYDKQLPYIFAKPINATVYTKGTGAISNKKIAQLVM